MDFGWLQPGQYWPLIWQVSDPSDTNVYYPQVTILNGTSLKQLAVVNLVDQGNGLYSANYLIPGDTSGLGFSINATLRVWTDINHSVISQNYNVENRTYLVQTRPKFNGGSGSGYVTDYNVHFKKLYEQIDDRFGALPIPISRGTIEKLVGSIIAANLKTIKFPSIPKYEKPAELERITVFEEAINKLVQALVGHSTMVKQSLSGLNTKLVSHEANFKELGLMANKSDARYEEMKKTITDAADQMMKYANEQVSESNSKYLQALSEAFDNVETVQVSERGKGIKRLPAAAPKVDYGAKAKRLMGL